MRNSITVGLTGENVLQKIAELRNKEPELKLLTRSRMITEIFNRYYDERIKNKQASEHNNARVV